MLFPVGLCPFTQPEVFASVGERLLATSRAYQYFCYIDSSRYAIFAVTYIADLCVVGCFLFNYFNEVRPDLVTYVPPLWLLAIYIGICLAYLFLKWLVYSSLGWIFFDESRTSLWLESYSTLLYYLGLALFPLVLFIVYFDLDLQITLIIGLFLWLFAKILMLYKWIKLFCNNLYGYVLLILYFCALEIVPCIMLYEGMVKLNDFLIIKF